MLNFYSYFAYPQVDQIVQQIERFLIDHGIDETDQVYEKTLLCTAIELRNQEAVRYLLERGANPNGVPDNHICPMELAVSLNCFEIAKLLALTTGFSTKGENDYSLLRAIQLHKGTKWLAFLLSCGYNIEQTDSDGYSSLSWCMQTQDIEQATFLLNQGACPNIIHCDVPQTPLYQAASDGNEDEVQLLLQHGAKIDLIGSYSPFAVAVHFHFFTVADILFDNGANINAQSPVDGHTAYLMAAIQNDQKALDYLQKKGAKDIPDFSGLTVQALQDPWLWNYWHHIYNE